MPIVFALAIFFNGSDGGDDVAVLIGGINLQAPISNWYFSLAWEESNTLRRDGGVDGELGESGDGGVDGEFGESGDNGEPGESGEDRKSVV